MPDKADLKEQLRLMDDQLSALIAVADEQADFLLGALLCEAHSLVARRYGEITAG